MSRRMRRIVLVGRGPRIESPLEHELLPVANLANVERFPEAAELLGKHHADVLVGHVGLGRDLLLELFVKARSRSMGAQLVVLAEEADPAAVALLDEGAFDYIPAATAVEGLVALIKRALAHSTDVSGQADWPGIVGCSRALSHALSAMENIRRADTTVLFSGPPGSGKSLLAASLHAGSPRGRGPLVRVACDEPDAELLELALFGAEAGTMGRRTVLRGLFEQAHGGSLFLDHVDRMPARLQEEVAAAIEGRAATRAGSRRPRAVDVRVMAATRSDLHTEVAARRFSTRLFYTLNVIPIHLLALATRSEDIEPLAEHFLETALAREQLAAPEPELRRRYIESLRWRPGWPDNVRDLRREIEAAVFRAGSDALCAHPAAYPLDARRAHRFGKQAPEGG